MEPQYSLVVKFTNPRSELQTWIRNNETGTEVKIGYKSYRAIDQTRVIQSYVDMAEVQADMLGMGFVRPDGY